MNNDADPNQKHYFTLLRTEERYEIFQKAAECPTEFTLWQRGNEDNPENFVAKRPIKADIVALKTAGFSLKNFKQSPLCGKIVLFKFLFQNAVYFGQGKFTDGVHGSGYALEMNEFLYRAQQRKDYRLQANNSNTIQIKIGKNVYEGVDISAGGISFKALIDDDDLTNKTIFKNVKIKVNQKTFEIPEIRIVKKILTHDRDERGRVYERHTLCAQFQNIPEDLDIALSNHVLMEARGEIITKKILGK